MKTKRHSECVPSQEASPKRPKREYEYRPLRSSLMVEVDETLSELYAKCLDPKEKSMEGCDEFAFVREMHEEIFEVIEKYEARYRALQEPLKIMHVKEGEQNLDGEEISPTLVKVVWKNPSREPTWEPSELLKGHQVMRDYLKRFEKILL